ncbi:T9SS type A sorting domain-containing protein, partial [candidate division TA06 bacterium]
AWTPGPSGSNYDGPRYTNLGSDEVPGNDTLMGMTFAFDAAILPILSPWATSAPAIDGVISVGEWDDAIRLDVSDVLGMPDGFDLPGSAILYVKNDSSNLYMACDAPPDPSATDWDQVGLYFDDNHDGAWPSASDSSEGNLWYQQFATGDVVDWRWIWGAGPDSFGTPRTVPFPFQCTPTSGNMQYEMTCPIGALGEELNAAPGDSVGFFLYGMDVGANARLGWWPYDVDATTGWSDPSVYGDLVLGDAPVGVEETHVRNRDRLSILLTAKPNPVTSAADILYQIPDRSKVSLTIYDVTGSVVRTLVNTTEDAGQHHVTWDGKDNAGFDVSTGPYFCLLSAGNETATGKLILLR